MANQFSRARADRIKTIAIITIISSGFLTVQPVPSTNTTLLQVPQPYYNMTNFGTLQASGGPSLISPDANIYKLAYHTGASGQPVSLGSTFPTETYHLSFEGPAVKCMSADESWWSMSLPNMALLWELPAAIPLISFLGQLATGSPKS